MGIKKGRLDGFHPWTEGKPAFEAYLISTMSKSNLWLALVEWDKKRIGEFYLVVFPESRSVPIAEIHSEANDMNGNSLRWFYKPIKQDGKNPQRADGFERVYGTRHVSIPIPADNAAIDGFFSTLATLADTVDQLA